MGSAYYDIAAILLIALNLFLYYSRRHLFTPQARIFKILIHASLGTALTDVISVVAYQNASIFPLWLVYATNTLYYLFQNALPPIACVFILALSGSLSSFRKTGIALFFIPWIAAILLIIGNLPTGFVFSVGSHLEYSRGPGLLALYGIALVYVAISLGGLLLARSRVSPRIFQSVILFLVLMLVPVAIQFSFPSLLVQNIGLAISELYILLTINDFDTYIDGLTSLFNRQGLAAQLDSLGRTRARTAAFLVTLENQKFLRHSLGPEAFMNLDRDIGKRLFGIPGKRRFASRLGPGQYVLILVSPDQKREKEENDRLLGAFEQPWPLGDQQLALKARACHIAFPEDSTDFQIIFQAQHRLSMPLISYPGNTMLGLADLSLEDSGRQLSVARAIQKALAGEGLDVHFQPIVSAQTKEIVAAEALVRLQDGELGRVPPDEFIRIAEQNGSIHRIGDFVVERSCDFLASLRAGGYFLSFLEVNISPVQCIQYHLDERLLAISRKHGLDCADLCFEVTETAAVLSQTTMRKTMDGISEAGFSIAIDDFGTGHSNISSLTTIPFTSVKLDRSLILSMSESAQGKKGVESMVAMFKRMGVTIVAEGVETAEQYETVRDMGVDLIQGYYFSKPLTGADFTRFLRETGGKCT